MVEHSVTPMHAFRRRVQVLGEANCRSETGPVSLPEVSYGARQ